MKFIHSLYLSLLSMIIISIFIIIGALFSILLNINLFSNTVVFASVLIIALNTLVIKGGCQLNIKKSIIIGLIQPTLIIISYILLSVVVNAGNIITIDFTNYLAKILIPTIIMVIAIISFIDIVEAPLKNNLGISTLGLLSDFIKHMIEESNDVEKSLRKMGEPIDTIVSFVSFRTKEKIKCLFVSPCVHPGPLGKLGGSNLPTILSNKFDHFTMVAHGPSTHDFNPVATSEIDKIGDAVKKGLEKIEYSSKASEFVRYTDKKSKIGVQFFNEGMVILSTFAPEDSDDIEFGVGLTMMIQSLSVCNVEHSIVVDCHNSFTPRSGEVLPGNPEVFELINLINTIEKNTDETIIKVGTYSNNMDDIDLEYGIGETGVKLMIVEDNNQRTTYILFDGNNMEKGFRKDLIEACKDLDINEIEVMTTDTHSVNTIASGYNPVGIEKRNELINYVKEGINIAIDDLEEVEVGTGTEKIENIVTFGPTRYTEFVATISSIISVSKTAAPILFGAAIILSYILIYYVI